jgi:WhiB family redox-sensing transcriptional regulator
VPPSLSLKSWLPAAACGNADTRIFFEAHPAAAKKLCADCTARAKCLEYALLTGLRHGVWGGLTSNERSALLRKRRRRQARAAQGAA